MKNRINLYLGLAIGVVYGGLSFALSLIQSDLGQNSLFDLSLWGYTYETAIEIVESLSSNSKNIYFWAIFPLDFFFPLLYCTLGYRGLAGLSGNPGFKKWAWLLPALLFVVDLSENFMVHSLFSGPVTETKVLIASTLTQFKWILVLLLLISLLVLGVLKIVARHKRPM